MRRGRGQEVTKPGILATPGRSIQIGRISTKPVLEIAQRRCCSSFFGWVREMQGYTLCMRMDRIVSRDR